MHSAGDRWLTKLRTNYYRSTRSFIGGRTLCDFLNMFGHAAHVLVAYGTSLES